MEQGLAVAAALVSMLALLPLAFIAWVTIDTGLATAVALIFRPRVGELLVNTLLLVAVTTPLCILLGVGLAWLTERSDLPGARLFAWLAVAPLAVPAFVHSYAWVGIAPSLHGLPAGVLISVLAYFPFSYLPAAAALRRLDPALEDVAASLGLAPWQVFIRVVVPQLRFAILGGALLIGLHLLAEYGLYAMIRFDTFTTAIVDQFRSTFNGPAANMLAGVLVCCCLSLLALDAWLAGRSRYARLGPGAARLSARVPLGSATLPCLLVSIAVGVLSLGVPVLTILSWLAHGSTSAWPLREIGLAVIETLGLAIAGAAATVAATLPVAWLAVRKPSRFTRALEASNYFVGALPGVVVALSLVTMTVRAIPMLYQTTVTLVVAYVVLFLPRALVSLKVSLAQVPKSLEEAAGILGRPPLAALLAITLRLAAPGIASAMALVGLGIANELTATMMLAPNGTETLATQFWALSSEIDYAGAAPYAALLVLLSLPMTILLHVQSRRASGR
ncbi:MAG: iron ABC transporter permease [Proteobacteria bacterium]|nr:iron ABC transporter permease [Pseudomonadota bacterium]